MARTWRVAYKGPISDTWMVKKGGRRRRSNFERKNDALSHARANARQGDTLIVERRDGSIQKEVTISTTNEERLDMNRGTWELFTPD